MTQSAGLLIYHETEGGGIEVLLSHPGGPIWEGKDTWSIPKGEQHPGEDLLATAYREFDEEVGIALPDDEPVALGHAPASNKINYIWALEFDLDISKFVCRSMVKFRWPPLSGRRLQFPENDKVAWFRLHVAKTKLFKSQVVFIDRLALSLGIELSESDEPKQQSLL